MKDSPREEKESSKYTKIKKIGEGCFGEIYLGEHTSTKKKVALKIEENDKNGRKAKKLLGETKILYKLRGEVGFPKIYHYSKDERKSILVLSLLGKSINYLFEQSGRKFSLKTVLFLAGQLITRLEVLHSKGFIHRDLKPENMMTPYEANSPVIYLIDFGLSKKYLNEKNEHIPFTEKVGLVGTARYTSINSHLGVEQSRRDDLESLGYILIYLLKGSLPWMNQPGITKEEKCWKIGEVKIRTPVEALCTGIPEEFEYYLKYVRALNFYDEPNYEFLRAQFRKLAQKNGLVTSVSELEMKVLKRSSDYQDSEASYRNGRGAFSGTKWKGEDIPKSNDFKSSQKFSDVEAINSKNKFDSKEENKTKCTNCYLKNNGNSNLSKKETYISGDQLKSNDSNENIYLQTFLKDNRISLSKINVQMRNDASDSKLDMITDKDTENLADSSINEYHNYQSVRNLVENFKQKNQMAIKNLPH